MNKICAKNYHSFSANTKFNRNPLIIFGNETYEPTHMNIPYMRRVLSSGIQRTVVRLKSTDVSKEHDASIFKDSYLLYADFLFRLFFDPEDGGDVPPKRR
jgi:hypothetical protein